MILAVFFSLIVSSINVLADSSTHRVVCEVTVHKAPGLTRGPSASLDLEIGTLPMNAELRFQGLVYRVEAQAQPNGLDSFNLEIWDPVTMNRTRSHGLTASPYSVSLMMVIPDAPIPPSYQSPFTELVCRY